MKSRIVQVKQPIIFSITIFLLFVSAIFMICMDQEEQLSMETKQVTTKVVDEIEIKNEVEEVKIEYQRQEKEYENFPKEYRGYSVIGKIEIPKIGIEKYILEETSEESLKVAVTKICGPKANEVGNLCISGHNYPQTFGKLKNLEIGDKIMITDTYSKVVTYQVYETYKVNPTEVSCLSQETLGEKEITLITCTLGAIKRTIVKAIEVYD